jgi:hypothetical protein
MGRRCRFWDVIFALFFVAMVVACCAAIQCLPGGRASGALVFPASR